MIFHAKNSCTTDTAAKNANAYAPPNSDDLTTLGNVQEMIHAMIQWVKLPRVCPFERTLLGKISEMNTHITAPCDKAKEAMNRMR